MSSGFMRRISKIDIPLVQNLIEHCLLRYMSKTEVVETLLDDAKIEPGFTELVWKKLEEKNQEFFRAYRIKLTVKEQINQFNKLLEQQVQLMKLQQTAVASQSYSSGPYIYANEASIPSHSHFPSGNDVLAVDVGQSERLNPLLIGSEDAGSTQYHHPTDFSPFPRVPPHHKQFDNQSYAGNPSQENMFSAPDPDKFSLCFSPLSSSLSSGTIEWIVVKK